MFSLSLFFSLLSPKISYHYFSQEKEEEKEKQRSNIFGLPLEQLKPTSEGSNKESKGEIEEVGGEVGNNEDGAGIPIILRECIQYIISSQENLETEGLFRYFLFDLPLIFFLSLIFFFRVSPNYRELETLKTLFITPNTIVDLSIESVCFFKIC